MFIVLLALLPAVVWIWVLCIEDIKEKYFNNKHKWKNK